MVRKFKSFIKEEELKDFEEDLVGDKEKETEKSNSNNKEEKNENF